MEHEELDENRRVVRVTHKGERIRRIKCRPGFKREDNKCVPITGSERATKRRAIRQAIRTKKAAGGGARARANRKRLKAMRKRKSLGL